MEKGRGIMYLVGVLCIWWMEKGQGIMYLVGVLCIRFNIICFSFPAVPHKPVLLYKNCPDGYYAVRQVQLYLQVLYHLTSPSR